MLSRLVSLLLLAVMVNVTALGGGVYSIGAGSDLHSDGLAAQPHDMAAMAGMDMEDPGPPQSEHGGAPAGQRCRLPWSPGCGSASLCAPVAMAVARIIAAPATVSRCAPVAAVVAMHASAESAPDHPPPRA